MGTPFRKRRYALIGTCTFLECSGWPPSHTLLPNLGSRRSFLQIPTGIRLYPYDQIATLKVTPFFYLSLCRQDQVSVLNAVTRLYSSQRPISLSFDSCHIHRSCKRHRTRQHNSKHGAGWRLIQQPLEEIQVCIRRFIYIFDLLMAYTGWCF